MMSSCSCSRVRLVIVEHLVGNGDELLPVTLAATEVVGVGDLGAVTECDLDAAWVAMLLSCSHDIGHGLVAFEVALVDGVRCGHSEEVNSSRRAGVSMMA